MALGEIWTRRDELGDNARIAFDERVEAFATEVFKEAERLEAANNSTGGEAEITATIVSDADIIIRRNLGRASISKLHLVLRVLTVIASVMTGVFATVLDSGPGQVGFAVSIGATILLTTISYLTENGL